MDTRPILCLSLAALMILGTTPAAAQFPVLGTVEFSFDAQSTQTDLQVEVGTSFQLFLRVYIPAGFQICGLEGSFIVPSGVELVSYEWYPPNLLDLGPNFSTPPERTFIVGIGDCLPAEGGVALGHWWLRVNEEVANATISVLAPGIAAASVSSFDDAGPGWVDANFDLILFESPAVSSAVYLNRTTVASESASFSTIKALY